MAKQPRFESQDIERLLRAILPGMQEDPFGRIEELLIKAAEELQKEGILTDDWQEQVDDQLGDIKSRTFGILLLQIFRALKFFFGLLPQGRMILLIIAAMGLAQTALAGKDVSLASIKDAVASTGIGAYLDQAMEDLRTEVTAIADNASELSDITSQVFVSLAHTTEQTLGKIEASLELLNLMDYDGMVLADQERVSLAMQNLAAGIDTGTSASNASSNAADIIGPVLRGIDDQIRTIPELALRLIRL